jgi:hypothetical protein
MTTSHVFRSADLQVRIFIVDTTTADLEVRAPKDA